MTYIVLPRKYRPTSFNQVVGQDHITQTLSGALTCGRLPHALCFTGPRGVGKTSVARILAKALNCIQGPTPNPCNQCSFCKEIKGSYAIDVQEIDAASNSSVEDIRELRESIRYKPQAARYRITILDEVHMLSKAAFNALLKILEEPPSHAIFILATTDINKIPLTIISRCQRYDFRRLSPNTLISHLKNIIISEKAIIPNESLNLIAREADGSIRDALSLLDQILSTGRTIISHTEIINLLGLIDREIVKNVAEAIIKSDALKILDLINQIFTAGVEIQSFYLALQEHFRNLAAAKASFKNFELFGLTKEEINELKKQANKVSTDFLHEVFDLLVHSEEFFRRSGNPRLIIEMTLIKLTQIKPVLSLDEIIERLSDAINKKNSYSYSNEISKNSLTYKDNFIKLTQKKITNNTQNNQYNNINNINNIQKLKDKNLTHYNSKDNYTNNIKIISPPLAPEKTFKDLIKYIAQKKTMLAAYLQQSSIKLDKKNNWIISFPPSILFLNLINSKTELELNLLANKLWETPPIIRLLIPANRIIRPYNNPKNESEITNNLIKHEMIKKVIKILEAKIKSLNPLV